MKCMTRNAIPFYYSLYLKKQPVLDEYGNETGEFNILRENPVEYKANISAARGETYVRLFGEIESYDKVIMMSKNSPPIDEHTVLWIDSVPSLNPDGTLVTNAEGKIVTPHDYVVKKVAKSINSVAIAISKVTVQ